MLSHWIILKNIYLMRLNVDLFTLFMVLKLKLEKYLITPNVNFYGGFIFDGEDIDLCDDCDYEEGYRVHIRQKIENSVLVTRLEKEYERNNGLKVKEKSYMEVKLEKGQLLVYVQGTGFVIPEYKLCTVDEAVNLMSILKGE